MTLCFTQIASFVWYSANPYQTFQSLTFQTLLFQLLMAFFQVVEHGLGHLPFTEKQVVTPTGICALSKSKQRPNAL